MRAASSAAIISPVSSISIAALRGTLRDSATIGVEQNRPILTPGVANFAARDATARSQLATSWRPPPSPWRDRGDDRLRQRDHLLHHAAAQCHDVLEIGAAAIVVGAMPIELFEIVAGGKCRAVGGDHHGAHRAVMRDGGERIAERRQHASRQAVARRRPIERENSDIGHVLA